jgi:hypothetical protein
MKPGGHVRVIRNRSPEEDTIMSAQRYANTCPRFLAALTAGLLLLANPRLTRADTDYLRELAKNRTRLLIVRSGPQALPLARRLQQTILANGDSRGRGEEYCRIANSWAGAADLLKDPAYAHASVVFLLTGDDLQSRTENLPPDLLRLLPWDQKLLGGRQAVVQGVLASDRPGTAAFRVALYAPDATRLGRLYERFTQRRADSFRELPFAEHYTTNRLALFSAPEDRETVERWGRLGRVGIWDETQWRPLSERATLTPDQLAECTEVFFIDRSRRDTVLPLPAASALEGQRIGPTTVAILQRESEKQSNPVVVFSAPSRLLLQTRVARFPDVPSLSAAAPLTDALDLSHVGSTTLLVVGGSDVPPDTINRLHTEIAKNLRRTLGIAVEPRGSVVKALEDDLALQMVQGASDTRGFLQRKYPTRYAWLFTITQVSGGTTYQPSERKMTPDLDSFSDREPTEPEQRKDEKDQDFEKRCRDWRNEHRQWERKRRDWEDHYRLDPCMWELTLTRNDAAEVQGLLQLIDVKTPNGAAFLWERECRYQATDSATVRTEQTTVRGHDNRPTSLETPSASDHCPPALVFSAAVQSAGQSLAALREEALLPDLSARPAPPSGDDTKGATLAGVPFADAKVAEVEGQTITLNIGANRGVRLGDRYEVILATKETIDPDTGRVLRVRAAEVLTVTVTQVDNEAADARPATPQDAAKLTKVTVGMAVRRAVRGH